jgi:hypothetical protein
LLDFYKNYHTPATPNTSLILALGYICEEYTTIFKNIKNLDTITKQKADYFYSCIDKNKDLRVYNA